MRYDALIVGGSFAGLSAALQLVRARRQVLVIDAGRPRNRFAKHSHGVLAQDGLPGSEILARAHEQVAQYPTATIIRAEALGARVTGNTITVQTRDGVSVEGRRLLLATGVVDVLPDIPGLSERWGTTIAACPYCHGFEIGGGSIGVLATGAMSVHQALLIADWGDVTFFTNDSVELDNATRSMLVRRAVRIEPVAVSAIEGTAPAIDGIRLIDGRLTPIKAMFLAAPVRMASGLAEQLGCGFDATPMGAMIRTDALKATTIPAVFAAGDAARMPSSITLACADGAVAAVGIHQSLIAEEVAA